MKKVLVVFYSLTGNTKMIAEAIAESINSDILELKPVKELKADSGMKYFWGGYQATMKLKPKLEHFNKNPLDYDIIFLGTPVWAWTYSPPIRSFLGKFDLKGKNVALWTSSDGDGVKAMNRFKEALKNSNILGQISFQSPLKNKPESAKEQAIGWAKELVKEL
ncbi:MAG: flavodoxin family protein [Promethearchaeota archaeon]